MERKEGIKDAKELSQKFLFDPKQGIDNPALSLADDVEMGSLPVPRYCLLTKNDRGTFGFFLRNELDSIGHVIRQVEIGGPAHRGGLRDGDRLLEVNGAYIDDLNPLRVVQKIMAGGKQVSLAVLDEKSYLEARGRNLNTAMLLPARGQPPGANARPRLCHFRRVEGGFGFSILASEGEKAPFHLMVTGWGPAEAAGVPPGARLIELNGVQVCHLTKTQVSKKLKRAGPAVTLLVMEPDCEEFYRRRGLKVTAAMADPASVPFKARLLQLVKGPHGYGFLLRQEKQGSKGDGQFLREVDAGFPAEKAGMKDGDRLLAVNGKMVEGLTHDVVVTHICASGNQVTLLVIDHAGDQFYNMLGLSPLLFHEEGDLEPPNIQHFDDLWQQAICSSGQHHTRAIQPTTSSTDQHLNRTIQPRPQPTTSSTDQHLNRTIQPRPRLCHLSKESSGYGFQLAKITDEEEIFITQVVAESPAHQAGLREGDLLIEVNGTNVEKHRYEEVVQRMKEDTGWLALLVVDCKGYQYFRDRGLPIRASMAENDGTSQKPADDTEVQGHEE